MNIAQTTLLSYIDGTQVVEYGSPQILNELVGMPVKVELISKRAAPIYGNIYTIDPESKSVVLVQFFDVEKCTPGKFVLIPGDSVLHVRPITPPLPEDLPMPSPLPVLNDQKDSIDNLPATPTEVNLPPTPSSSGVSFVSNSEELRETFKKMFRPSEAKTANEARHAKKRRERIVDALTKRNLKFIEQTNSHPATLRSVAPKKDKNTTKSDADENAKDNALALNIIVIGALKIYPPYGESDVICPNSKIKKNLMEILNNEKVFEIEREIDQ